MHSKSVYEIAFDFLYHTDFEKTWNLKIQSCEIVGMKIQMQLPKDFTLILHV